jgi:acyl-CoA thioesterase FadM
MTDSSSPSAGARERGVVAGSEPFRLCLNVSSELIEKDYRHVHHADSLKFLEQARMQFLSSIGFPNQSFLGADLFLVIARIEVSYLREVLEGPLEITVEGARCLEDGRTLALDQRLYRVSGGRRKLAIEATVYSVFMSGATKRAVPPPEDFLRALTTASRP